MKKLQLKARWSRSSKKKKALITILLLAIIGGGAAYALGVFDKVKENVSKPPEPIYSQLTGVEVSEEEAERPVLAVMIENSEFARPQTGVDSAGIVFESVTEGGITRYLTLFQENMPKDVGPVRSVRSHFVYWLMGFDSAVAHVGGSADALDLIEQLNTKDLTQFKHPEPYRRVDTREAPHNMYASTQKLQDLQKELGFETSKFEVFPRSSDSPAQTPDATKIALNYSGPSFAAEFRYRKASNDYVRFLAGQADIDAASKKQISVKNVVIIKMGGPTVQAIGSGEAVVLKNGTAVKGRWRQPKYNERIMLTDAQGKDIPLNRGDTWFAVIPSTGSATY